MGTWGTSAFEDDTAMEFYEEFCYGDQSIVELETAIDLVLVQNYDMDELLMEGFIEPLNALMSAEIVAAALGSKSNEYPNEEFHEELELPNLNLSRIKENIEPKLIDKINKVVSKIKSDENMHLYVLWLESESFDDWKKYLDELVLRIKQSYP
jgi:hypothetical protein